MPIASHQSAYTMMEYGTAQVELKRNGKNAMALINGAIIALVIIACLASVTLCASLFSQYNPAEPLVVQCFSREQQTYMRSVLRNMNYIDCGWRRALPVDGASSRFHL
jgi:hypothetical protein